MREAKSHDDDKLRPRRPSAPQLAIIEDSDFFIHSPENHLTAALLRLRRSLVLLFLRAKTTCYVQTTHLAGVEMKSAEKDERFSKEKKREFSSSRHTLIVIGRWAMIAM
jgi:hypothetical protein